MLKILFCIGSYAFFYVHRHQYRIVFRLGNKIIWREMIWRFLLGIYKNKLELASCRKLAEYKYYQVVSTYTTIYILKHMPYYVIPYSLHLLKKNHFILLAIFLKVTCNIIYLWKCYYTLETSKSILARVIDTQGN